jgi:hypothetical protein
MRALGLLAALFAAALALMAPARAEVVRLRCGDNMAGTGFAITIDVDLTNRTVFTVFDSDYPSQTSPADITDRFIIWRITRDTTVAQRLDRATGRLTWSNLRGSGWLAAGSPCHRIQGNVL